MKRRWILAATAIWPVLHALIYLVRFRSSPRWAELLYFVPTGLLAALTVSALVTRSRSPLQTTTTLFGALLSVPAALAGNVLGGLLGPVGITLYGLIPLTAGSLLGWTFGKRFSATR